MALLDELIQRINVADQPSRDEMMKATLAQTAGMIWVPQPGPQTEAYFCEADELFYGGQAGGGKTDLLMGLATTAHTDSLLLRRVNKDARSLMDRAEEIIGNTDGRNLSLWEWKRGEGKMEFGGCEHEKDKERRKGIPHDLKAFDEIGDFTESQFRFIKTWTRSSKVGQRCSVVCTGNPPTSAEGLWVIGYWAPWLDPKNPNPAKSGELRWFISDDNGHDKEVAGPGVYQLFDERGRERLRPDGTPDKVIARSRTFIRARLDDNKYYGNDYAAVLDALPAELRAAYRDGRFDLSLKDNPKQVIPTSWVMASVERWKRCPRPPEDVPMCAVGVDPTGGGDDEFVQAQRFDTWWAPLIVEPGKKYPLGSDMAGYVIAKRRDNALPIIDCGGGYGGGIIQTFEQNNIKYFAYKGAEASSARTKDGKLKFKNKRTESYWRMRELLDPDQPGGASAMLPDDPKLISDLTAPTFEVKMDGIVMMTKEDVCSKLGRSPDRGDAVVMSNVEGSRLTQQRDGKWEVKGKTQPSVNLGHKAQRRPTR